MLYLYAVLVVFLFFLTLITAEVFKVPTTMITSWIGLCHVSLFVCLFVYLFVIFVCYDSYCSVSSLLLLRYLVMIKLIFFSY